MTNNQSDTPTPSCYATFRDGKMDYSEFCVSENLGDFDVSELDADIDIVPLYSEAIVSELLAALSAERAKNAAVRDAAAKDLIERLLSSGQSAVELEAADYIRDIEHALSIRIDAAKNKALEDAAWFCDGAKYGTTPRELAAAIRAMKGTP